MSQTSKPQVDIEKEIMTAIDRCGSEGASLDDIQRYLKSTLKDNVPDLENIQSSLNTAVSKGLLLKLENGKYKIKGSAERTEKDDEDDDDEEEDENEEDDDDDDEEIMTVIDTFGSEGATLDDIQQYLESTLKNDVPDLESIQSRLNTAVDKELLELDNGKYKIKDYAELEEEDDDDEDDNDEDDDDEENDDEEEDDDEHCEDCKKDKENAQKVGRSVDKVSQDPNRNADSDTRNAGSSKAKKDANIPIPDDRDKVLKRRPKKDK